MTEKTEDEKKRVDELAAQWDRERQIRFEILEMQYAESLVLHGEFAERNEAMTAEREARINDCLSVVRHRAQVIDAIDKQTAILERIAVAMEKGAAK